jgi:hypothetical protein
LARNRTLEGAVWLAAQPAGVSPVPWFVFEANIAHYRERLARETDPKVIAMLQKLLAEEEAKLADYHAKNPRPSKLAE